MKLKNGPVKGCRKNVTRYEVISFVHKLYRAKWKIDRMREHVHHCNACARYLVSIRLIREVGGRMAVTKTNSKK